MFSITESIKYGWAKMKENMQLSLFSTLLMLAVGSVSGGRRGGAAVLGILATIFLIIVRIGYTKIFLRMNEGEKPKFSDLFSEYHLFWKYLGVSILTGLAVVGGLILLLLPGIYWAVRFAFSPIILIDTKIGVIASMKESYAITKGSFWSLLLFWIAIIAINFIGVILLGVGLLFTIPVSTFATIQIYRKLSSAKAGVTVEPQMAQ
jgi:uncharacterized membrane protein